MNGSITRLLSINPSRLFGVIALGAVFCVPAVSFSMSSNPNSATPAEKVECIVSGCNGELCVNANSTEEPLMSICVYEEKFSCYKEFGICEANETGECGWKQTKELSECFESRSSALEVAPLY